ncbi:hypothetical protein XENOCAPTIV_030709 [Xenoophorus captivus]|uniref:E3 ubiquitin-protein ligase Arkadia N-terminal domain-containing protein n=1 Tax=Xenoophorus captivus TaxID=1517983 RepID=A0ABV0RL90_9TELE
MKSEVPSEASNRQEHLKEPLGNPESMAGAKNFTNTMEVIGKAANDFEPLCESRHRPLRDTGTHRDSERSLPGRRKRKAQQAGPSDCSLKEDHISENSLPPQRARVELLQHPSEDERNNESSFSDCASSPSSSLRFGDSDTLSSDDEGEAGATGGQHKAPALPTGGGAAVGLRPNLGRTRGSRSHKWVRPEPEPVLLKRPCLSSRRPPHRKRFVKTAPGGGQRTQKQKERLLLKRKKREVIACRKYALLHSTSSSSGELSSGSSSASSTEAEDELYVDVSSTSSQPNSAPVATGALDEDVVVIEASPAPAPAVPASEEINVTSTDSEVEIVTVGHVRLGVLVGFGAVVVPRTVSRSRADGTGSQQSSSRCGRILGRWWISLSMRMMTTGQVCLVQEEKTQAQPCPDSHPAVSSTLRAAVPLLATCPSATLILAACKRRPLSRPPALSTATATLTILSTISITQHHSPREPYHFKSRAALWNAPVLCLPPVLESATAVAAAMQPTTMTSTYILNVFVFLPQQTLPVDLSNSSVRGSGTGSTSFHGSTSAFDPCCPGSSSRPPAYVSHTTPGPSQPAVVDSFSSSMVAQPQTQPQPCRHYMHPPYSLTLFLSLNSRWLSNTITASSALLRLPSLPRKPPTHTSGSSAGRISHSSLLSYSTATPPFRSLCSPWTSPSPFCPPPPHLKRSPGPAPSTGPPDPAAPYAASGAFGAKDPSARDAAEDGGSEKEDDAAPHVSAHMSVHLHTPTGCTPTMAMDTTSTCHRLCLPILASLSREPLGGFSV